MNHLPIIFIYLISISFAISLHNHKNDESTDDFNLPLDEFNIDEVIKDPNLLHNLLSKRVQDSPSLAEDYRDTCDIKKSLSSAIIKTNASLEAGAIFLNSPKIESRSCAEECCLNDECNAAIIKGTAAHELACYLFDCRVPNVCIFDSHESFKVVMLANRGSPLHTQVEHKHGHLDNSDDKNSQDYKEIQLVELSGWCKENEDCAQKNGGTICYKGKCSCTENYHKVANECRRNCASKNEFECLNIDRPTHLECIAIYDHCDVKSIAQCSDGSDEFNCTKHDSSSGGSKTVHKIITDSTKASITTLADTNKQTTLPMMNADLITNLWRVPVNKMAVAALAAGLALTLVAIVMGLCRLKECRRRRARKLRLKAGLGGDDQDADYLINGMYL